MSNLLASLTTAAESLRTFEQALNVVQNNVTNATTPGYVRQQADLVALNFQPEVGLPGGVRSGSLVSSRSLFAERTVWEQAQGYGRFSQTASGLARIEPVFDINAGSGIAAALDRFYAAFSQLSVTPNELLPREVVIQRAAEVAQSFQLAATELTRAFEEFRRETTSVVEEINRLAADIRDLNIEIRQDFRNREDAGIDARLYTALEELSFLTDFTALPQEDGSVTVLLGGQIPLVIGDKVFEIRAGSSGAAPEILDYNGQVITGTVREGRLAGLLDLTGNLLPSYLADLNRLAQSFADRVNGALAGGVDLNGLPPAVNLFEYDAALGAAYTLKVSGILPEQVAAALPGAPGGNGNALALAALATSPQIDGMTFTEAYGRLGAGAGRDLAAVRAGESTHSLLLTQARQLRDEVSGVNLDEEAAALIRYQRAYQASAQLIGVLNEMTEVVLDLLR